MFRITEKSVNELFYKIHWPEVPNYSWRVDYKKGSGGWALSLRNLSDDSEWRPFAEQRMPTREFYQFLYGLQFCLNGYLKVFTDRFCVPESDD